MSMEAVTSFGPVITSIRTISDEEFDLFELDIKSEIEIEDFAWEDALFIELSPEEDEPVICTICIHEYQEAKGSRRFSERVMDNLLWCPHFTVDGSRDDDMVPQTVTNNRKRPRAECSTQQQAKRRRAQPKRHAQPKRRPGQTKRRRVPSTRPSTNDNMLAVQEPVVIVQNIDFVEEIEEQMKNYLAQSSDCTTLTNFLSSVNVSEFNID